MKRSELYAAVWSRPIMAVAREWGVSDTWVNRVCRHHNVPVPSRGHWNKIRAGHEPQAAVPLPEGEDVDVVLKMRATIAVVTDVPAVAAAGGETPAKRRAPSECTSPSDQRDLAAEVALLERDARQALQHRAMERVLSDLTVTLVMAPGLNATDWRDWLVLLHEEVRQRAPRCETIERAMKRFSEPKRHLR